MSCANVNSDVFPAACLSDSGDVLVCSPLARLSAQIRDVRDPVELLVDTGASVCVVSAHFMFRHRLSPFRLRTPLQLQTAAGGVISALTGVALQFSLRGVTYTHMFYVIPALVEDLILGRDFLCKHRLLVRIGSSRCRVLQRDESNLRLGPLARFDDGSGPPVHVSLQCCDLGDVASGDVADCASDLFQSLPVRLQPLLPTSPTYHASGAMLLPPSCRHKVFVEVHRYACHNQALTVSLMLSLFFWSSAALA